MLNVANLENEGIFSRIMILFFFFYQLEIKPRNKLHTQMDSPSSI